MMLTLLPLAAANKYDNPDTIVVSRDGTGEFRTIDEAIEVCRAFMDYSKVIYVKKGVYKEKLILPSWLTNITICDGAARKSDMLSFLPVGNDLILDLIVCCVCILVLPVVLLLERQRWPASLSDG